MKKFSEMLKIVHLNVDEISQLQIMIEQCVETLWVLEQIETFPDQKS